MMKAFLKKLKSKAGESLVESLAAILIFTMASIVMYTMVTTSADLNAKTKEMDAKNQADLVAVEKGDPEFQNGSGTVTFSVGGETIPVSVDIYGGKDGSLYAYFVAPTGG